LFISSQVISPTGYSTLNDLLFQIISQIEKAVNSIATLFHNINNYFKSSKELSQKISELEKELSILKTQNQLLQKIDEENKMLREQLGLKKKADYKFISADIIGYDFKSEFLKIIRLNKGSNDGIRNKLAVLTPDGIIGIIISTGSNTSEVLLINSTSSAVGVSIPEAKVNAIAYGTGGALLKIKFIPMSASLTEGLRVITSGTDEIFPPGLPVAITTSATTKFGLYQEIMAQPSVNLYNLNNVMILATENSKTNN
jgi:rod shape-determining protein MreC